MATKQYRTPGVYIQEPNSFPPSIVGVETAVPCFIGYTAKAEDSDTRSLNLVPKRVESMAEFAQFYGGGYPEEYYLAVAPTRAEREAAEKAEREAAAAAREADPTAPPPKPRNLPDVSWGTISLDGTNLYDLMEVGKVGFNLYNSMRLFYANGGGSCYIISCGTFGTTVPTISANHFSEALKVCAGLIGPTMVAIPDAMLLPSQAEYDKVAAALLTTCATAGDRMALLDIWGADVATKDNWDDQVTAFRDGIRSQVPSEMWRFGAAYFPPLVTSVVSPDEIDISNFADDAANLKVLKNALKYALGASYPNTDSPPPSTALTGTAAASPDLGSSNLPIPDSANLSEKGQLILTKFVNQIGSSKPNPPPNVPEKVDTVLTHKQLTQALVAMVPGFRQLLAAVAATQGVLPPSGAIAGVWTTNDSLRGVWNAPANTGIATMIMPKLQVDHQGQEDLNVPVQGLAVNAIRTFQGRGSLIWGARTLDSNSNDWRYIQVRRTMIYVEQSVKQALEAMVFKPNTAQTWVTVVSMIESFLHGLWAAGGLMGSTSNEAYVVQAGLGSTMTPQDVLEGVMRVHITLQMVHPAEFIELTFKQQMLGGA